MKKDAGFTTVELLIVGTIAGILGSIATSSWLSFVNTQRLDSANSQIYQAMRSAQSKAKKNSVDWQFSIKENNNTVQWAVHPESLDPNSARWQKLDPNIQLDSETTLRQSNGVRRMKFNHLGTIASPLGRVTLSSKDCPKNERCIKRCVFVSTILGAMRTSKEQQKPKKSNNKEYYCY
ncbi:MAG: Tfp pilus assembly protein FimT/FimU [Prochloraceae cyanobacterium]